MSDENTGRSRRSLLKVGAAVGVTAFGLSKVASAAKERALEKKGYVFESKQTKKYYKKRGDGKKKASKKKAPKKKAAKKKAAKKKAPKKKAAKKKTAKKKAE